MVQQVSELVEDGLDLAMGQQRGLAAGGRGQIAAVQPQVGSEALGSGAAGDQRVHPGAVALVLAREVVGVVGPEVGSVGVLQPVGVDTFVPNGHSGRRSDADPEELVRHFKESLQNALVREIWPQVLLVERVSRLAQLLGLVGHVPGLQFASGEFGQFFVLHLEGGLRSLPQVPDEIDGPPAGLCHPVFKDQVGEVLETQELGFLASKGEDLRDVAAVVVRAGRRPGGKLAIHPLAHSLVVEVGYHRQVAGSLEGEAPAIPTLGCRALPSRFDRAQWEACKIPLGRDHQIEGVGRIEHVLRKLGRNLREFDVDLEESRLRRGVELSPTFPEVVDRLAQEA